MEMTKEQARAFITDELIPIVKVSDPQVYSVLSEDFQALEIALVSGNHTLVFAMASYIHKVRGLLNGLEIAQKITSKVMS